MRLLYMENAIKYMEIARALILANCFVNQQVIGCGYQEELENEIKKNCPDNFKKEIRIPEFFMNIVKSKVSNKCTN